MVFKSAVDWWFYAVIAVSAVIVLIALYPLARSGQPWAIALAIASAVIPLGLPVWLLLTTDYTVSQGVLLVRSGPFSWSIPLAQIRAVGPSRSLLSSPALSVDRIEIQYGRGKRILVSPADREGFLRAIGHPPPGG